MRRVVVFFSAVLLAATCIARPNPFSAAFASGGKLRIHSRSGSVRVIGTDEAKISVDVSGKNAEEAGDMQIRLKGEGGASELSISGGPREGITLTIRIPRNTDLYARVPFGEVAVEGVVGNKDISLHAGDLTVSVGSAADYAHVDASVMSGEIDGEPFGESHGGLFRSFEKEGTGKYRLHAHVGAGQLTLQ